MNKTISIVALLLLSTTLSFGHHLKDEMKDIMDNATEINITMFDTDESGSLMLDHNGMLWIGSGNGLVSYDGYNFKTYKSDAYTPGILPNNNVMSTTEDHDGNIWIGTRDGLVKMNRKYQSFKTYRLPKQSQRIIYCLYTTSDGTVWIGTDGGLTVYDKTKDTFFTYNFGRPCSVKSIVEDKKGYIYVGTWSTGLIRLHPNRKDFDRYPPLNQYNSAYSLFLDSRERLWIGTWEYGIVMIENPNDTKNPIIHHYNDTGSTFKIVNNIIEDPITNTIWASSRNGISIYDSTVDQFVNYPKYKLCNDITTDRRGHIFVGTVENGIIKFNTNKQRFNKMPLDLSNYNLPLSNIESIHTSDGRWFWLGLKPCGLALYDKLTQRTLFNMEIPVLARHPEMENITKAIVPSIVDNNGDLWMANSSYGVYVIEKGGDIKLLTTNNCHFIEDDYVNCIFRDSKGNMWIGQRTGLSVAQSPLIGTKIKLQLDKNDFTYCDVRGISEDHKGNIWIATENEGIIKLSGDCHNPSTLKVAHYCSSNGKLVIDAASQCLEDSRRRIWAVSNSGGLFEYDPTSDKFVPRNHDFHITESSAHTILEDQYKNLWMTTEKSLLKLTFDNSPIPRIKTLTYDNTLGKRWTSTYSLYRFGNYIYIGGKDGLISFVPDKRIKPMESTAALIVTDLIIDDEPFSSIPSRLQKEISETSPIYTTSITIPHSVKKFSVEFALLNYFDQEQTKYAYFLKGYDKDWHFIKATTRRATFENLSPGEYQLFLKATDSSGNVRELPMPINIHILPPWYMTWWALAVYLILVAAIIYCGIIWYREYIKTKNRLQMAVVFTNITHELLTPLTVISAVVDEMKIKEPSMCNEYGLINRNISKITRLLRQILEVRKSQAGQLKLKVSKGNLVEFITMVCDNIRPMADTKQISLLFNNKSEAKLEKAWFDTDKVDKILYNLISNAIKYGKNDGFIDVTLSAEGNDAVISVADNGIGMTRQQLRHIYTRFLDGDYRKMKTAGTGIGLSLTRDLTLLHHGHIKCKSQENEGTTFTLTLPIARKAYSDDEIETDVTDYSPTESVQQNITTGISLSPLPNVDEETKEYKLLIVEDNEELLRLMESILSRRYQVLTAKNGKQALKVINKEELDIVVSDVMMPVMDGIELTRLVKSDKNYAQLPIILLTAKTRNEDRNLALRTGADDYITKPFSLNDLELRVDNIIENRRRIRKKFSMQTDFKVEEQHFSNPDEAFLQKAIDCVMKHINDSDYDRETFATDMCMSSSTLYNKLRAITGQSITGFITSIRLKEACNIMRKRPDISISELSMSVGFNTPKYFTKCFKKEFGIVPSEYAQQGS